MPFALPAPRLYSAIDHINLLAADVRATRVFLQELLGMRLTEQVIFDDGSEKAS